MCILAVKQYYRSKVFLVPNERMGERGEISHREVEK